MSEMLKLFMPIVKTQEGSFLAILSDNSIDRDGEIIGKSVLVDWAKNKSLNALANHKNLMENWIGGWKNFKVIEREGHSALVAEPMFFSAKANPLAAQIKQQVIEALDAGMVPGVSIGAIPHEDKMMEIDGKSYKVHTKAELVEASWTPVPANKHAIAVRSLAKQFGIETEEETTMVNEKRYDEKELNEAVAKAVEKAVSEIAKDSIKTATQLGEDVVKANAKIEADRLAEVSVLKSQVADLTEKAVNLKKGAVEAPLGKDVINGVTDKAPTIEMMLKARYGIKIE